MRKTFARKSHSRSGMTLVETTIAATISFVLGAALFESSKMATHSTDVVVDVTEVNQVERQAKHTITNEIRFANEDHLSLDAGIIGNSLVRFKLPIDVNGRKTWGVPAFTVHQDSELYDADWGGDSLSNETYAWTVDNGDGTFASGVYDPTSSQVPAMENWFIRYRTQNQMITPSLAKSRLVRQIVDENNQVRDQKIVMKGLETTLATPAFKVSADGDMYKIELNRRDDLASAHGKNSTFYFKLRN